jgi:hypothetical protein
MALHPEMLVGEMVLIAILLGLCAFFVFITKLAEFIADDLAAIFTVHASVSERVKVPVTLAVVAINLAIIVLAAFVTLRQVMKIANLYLHVRFFKSYVGSIPRAIRDFELEALVISAAADRSIPGLGYRWRNYEKVLAELKGDEATPSSPMTADPSPPDSPTRSQDG